MIEDSQLIAMTVTITAAYVGNNRISQNELHGLIQSVFLALKGAGDSPGADAMAAATLPAVTVKRSINDDHLVCLEDGKAFKSLKRHLAAHHGLTPAAYREKWNLPKTYPMVAPAYTKTRSRLAIASGLGKKPKKRR